MRQGVDCGMGSDDPRSDGSCRRSPKIGSVGADVAGANETAALAMPLLSAGAAPTELAVAIWQSTSPSSMGVATAGSHRLRE